MKVYDKVYCLKSNSNLNIRVWIRSNDHWDAIMIPTGYMHMKTALKILKEEISNASEDPATLAYQISQISFVSAVEVLLDDESGYYIKDKNPF
jgi:hypothetical protein